LSGYSCQLVAREVCRWFDRHYSDAKPFFIYVAFNEVHTRIASPPALMAHYPAKKPKIAEYLANVENLDSAVGVILQKIADLEQASNTLVLFSSDNGPLNIYPRSDGGLRGRKSWLYEGGIRVPGIVRWPDHVQKGQVINTPAGFTDLLPTITEICDIELPLGKTLDGISIQPLLSGRQVKRNRPLFWFFYRTYPEVAMRMGDYVILGKSDDTVRRTHFISTIDMDFIKQIKLVDFELYNIVQDPGQEVDVSKKETEALRIMKVKLVEQLNSVINEGPYWTGLAPYSRERARYQKPLQP
jgi:arylsulfatase A